VDYLVNEVGVVGRICGNRSERPVIEVLDTGFTKIYIIEEMHSRKR